MTEISGTSYDAIERTVRRLERAQVATFEYQDENVCLRLTLGGANPVQASAGIKAYKSAETGKASAAGIFTSSHPVSNEDAMASGTPVRAGQIVGYVQVGPVVRPVIASRDGVIGRRLVDNGTLVGAGRPLFELHEPKLS
jgi:acetyl-CoA carboxylase biotin carboxyl carrier protein